MAVASVVVLTLLASAVLFGPLLWRVPINEIDFTARCGLIIGNEAHGVSEELRSAAFDASIPTVGVESLNAAMAAAILLYEARRQRALKP